MAKLAYSVSISLDGYINDEHGDIGFSVPTEEQHAYYNERERAVGTYLFGRRLYETMRVWDDMDDAEPVMQEYKEVWEGIDKVVYSSTLDAVASPRTRLERTFDADAVRALKTSSDKTIGIGGAGLAASALRAGVVAEIEFSLCPVVIGGGTPALAPGLHLDLDLLAERRFDNGVVIVNYRVR